jgi:hypothetical protein
MEFKNPSLPVELKNNSLSKTYAFKILRKKGMTMKKTTLVILSLTVIMLFLLLAQLPKVVAEQFQYVGNRKCIACHRAEYQSWQKDPHSRALDSLKPGTKGDAKIKAKLDPKKDYAADASCLVCHSIGYGKSAAPVTDLTNVGCESCHGPGSKYKSPIIMNKKKYQENREAQHKIAMEAGLIEPTEQVCITCHNAKSPTWKGFDYKKMIEEVKHKK